MNALLQGLLSLDCFTDDLIKFCKANAVGGFRIAKHMPLSSAFAELAAKQNDASPRQKMTMLEAIKNAVKDQSLFTNYEQQDAQEFLIKFLGQIRDECLVVSKTRSSAKKMRNPVEANFYFTQENYFFCERCPDFSTNADSNIFLSVGIEMPVKLLKGTREKQPERNLQKLLDQYFAVEKISKKCKKCSHNGAQIQHRINELPKYLIIFVKRYAYTPKGVIKLNDKMKIPEYLEISNYCKKPTTQRLSNPSADSATVTIKADEIPEDIKSCNSECKSGAGDGKALRMHTQDDSYKKASSVGSETTLADNASKKDGQQPGFRLVAAINHVGASSNRGHYVCNAWSSSHNGWLHYNDEVVKPIKEQQLTKMNYNGYIFFYINGLVERTKVDHKSSIVEANKDDSKKSKPEELHARVADI